MSQENLSEALSTMGFQTLPSMSELRKMWLKKSQLLHPDKFTDVAEKASKTKDFQDLNNAYQVIGKYLIKEGLRKEKQKKTEEKENKEDNDDESDEHEFFKQFNMDIRNKDSHTVIIENDAAEAWKTVFEERYGASEDKGLNGMMFRVPNYKVGVKSCNITIHLYPMPKSNKKSKLLIQSGNQHLNDIFVFKELRDMYKEVRKIKKSQPINTMRTPKPRSAKASVPTKPKFTPTQKLKRTCNDCKETFVTLGEMKVHRKEKHSEKLKEEDDADFVDCTDSSEEENDHDTDDKNYLPESSNKKVEMEKNVRKCQLCDEKFQSTRQLENHRISHHSEASLSRLTATPISPTAPPAPVSTTSPPPVSTSVPDSSNNLKKENLELKERLETIQKELDECRNQLRKIKASKNKQDAENKNLKDDKKDCHEKLNKNTQKIEELLHVNKMLNSRVDSLKELNKQENDKNTEQEISDNKKKGFRRESPASEAKPVENTFQKSCIACEFKTKNQQILNEHILTKHTRCEFCKAVFFSTYQLTRHINIHHADPLRHCGTCSYKTKSDLELREHKDNIHDKDIRQQSKVCRYWLSKSCRFGSQCKYEHPENTNEERCRYQERCNRGQKCKFYHETRSETIQCRYQNKCMRIPYCKFSHPFLSNPQSDLDVRLPWPGMQPRMEATAAQQPRMAATAARPTVQQPVRAVRQPVITKQQQMTEQRMEEILKQSM